MHNQLDESTRTWGMMCHLSALAGFFFPFGFILAPLVVWLTQKNKHPFIAEQGKESVNFQISIVIYLGLLILVMFVGFNLGFRLIPSFSLLVFISLVFAVPASFWLIATIIAAIKAYNGQFYRYPFNIRLLK
ncbi:DUF4870 domain-containing protein [Chroococcidiopsis sp. CCALA 051]|uniref:DUF4870 domain-containing protein n=1 Tax=Chroococcidiopsis sp. CCALA 051 TaxID=869949 RepID=UPI000D0D05C4|nr:DUF4870 domain-containing protein [Chroococcidiopsis sp. CCALA 051]MBE9019589.1 DUF4870 domain-containing protein [Chroococcidiopsidales cyanobacterium LEGE 13417]PSM45483.1 DUF4870 domain-containing protein [Chroococcidiopsis sp. CCALA 051]